MESKSTNKTSSSETKAICIKVDSLRKQGYENLEEWMKDPNHLYVGRRGRIFITDPETKERHIFHYKDSKWANPFKIDKEHTAEEVVGKYKEYLVESGLINEIQELKGKVLGCFCKSAPCHAHLLTELINN